MRLTGSAAGPLRDYVAQENFGITQREQSEFMDDKAKASRAEDKVNRGKKLEAARLYNQQYAEAHKMNKELDRTTNKLSYDWNTAHEMNTKRDNNNNNIKKKKNKK